MTKVREKLSKKNKYYISENRRRELKYFCYQYNDWKRYLSTMRLKHGTDEWDDPTGDEAIKRVIYERNIKLVEDTAKKCFESYIYDYLFKFITEDKTYAQMSAKYNIPCGRRQFYEYTQRFFYMLSQEKQSI